ncbi:MAG: hypothetical protein P4L20_10560 [Acidimicrobiales bacterium]|nr:hypothetical protein [Acidimicrobiales bacterium]
MSDGELARAGAGGVAPVVVVVAPVVVVVAPVVVVVAPVVVVVAPVVVVVDPVVVPPPATAITGAIGLAEGVEVVMPDGVNESFGYAVQLSASAFPATVSDRSAVESSWIVTDPLVAVNPETVAGVEGSDRLTPAAGTGLGMGTLKSSGPSGVVAGVAPLASIWAVAEPVRLG